MNPFGKISNGGEFRGLPVRIANCLCNLGVFNRRQVVNSLRKRRLQKGYGYGLKTHRIVCEWLGESWRYAWEGEL